MNAGRRFRRRIVEDDVRSICRQLAVGTITAGTIGFFLDPGSGLAAAGGPVAVGVCFAWYGITGREERHK